MLPVDRETLELEIGVFAGLVADLDDKDDHVLEVLERILERASSSDSLPEDMHGLCIVASALVTRMLSGEIDFADGYRELCNAVDQFQRWLMGRAASRSLGR